MNSSVPFLDLVSAHTEDEEAFVAVFREALRSGMFIGGRMVEAFEKQFALFCDTKYCVGVGNGTDALRFALIASGVGPGDLVITVPNTFIATTEAISQAGASPVFVDIEPESSNMDPGQLRSFLEKDCEFDGRSGTTTHRATGKRVAAVVPVHLYGQIADMDAIRTLADTYRLIVVEDACQAHGAEYLSERDGRWRKAGGMGVAAAFSFYPGKNLGAFGEAGAVTTNDDRIAQTIRMLRDHGQAKKYIHVMEGYNGRLDAIQAGILEIKLARLPQWNEQRRRIAERYSALLQGIDGVTTPQEPSGNKGVYHLYVIRTERRDELQKFLSDQGIATGLHYPLPLHLQQAYQGAGMGIGAFPVAESVSRSILSLPMFPALTEQQQDRVVQGIREFHGAARVSGPTAVPRTSSSRASASGSLELGST